jgi:hypothetical protein
MVGCSIVHIGSFAIGSRLRKVFKELLGTKLLKVTFMS